MNERVVGHVGVEGRHDPISIGPGVGPFGVDLVAVGVGVADDVEPVLGHPLAVARRGEEPIDDPLVGAGGLVCQEGVDLFGRRREARQIERHPPEPLAAIGFGRRKKPLGLEPGADEAVDVVAWPARVAHGWGGGADDGAEGPVIAPVDEARPVDPFGPQGPGVDPGREQRHFVRGKPRHVRIGRRHLHLGLIAPRKSHKRTLRPLPRHDRRAMAVAAAEGLGADVEPQPALRLLAGVARGAGAVEEGADVADEVGGVGRAGQARCREKDHGGRRDGADTAAWRREGHGGKSLFAWRGQRRRAGRQPSLSRIASVASWASATHSTIFSGSGENSSSMLTVPS